MNKFNYHYLRGCKQCYVCASCMQSIFIRRDDRDLGWDLPDKESVAPSTKKRAFPGQAWMSGGRAAKDFLVLETGKSGGAGQLLHRREVESSPNELVGRAQRHRFVGNRPNSLAGWRGQGGQDLRQALKA